MSTTQNPCEPLEWERQFKRLLEKLSNESRIKKNKTMAKYHAVIALGGYTGLRPKALLGLSWTDVMDKESDFFRESKTLYKRRIKFNDDLKNLLEADFMFLNGKDPDFPILHNRNGDQITTQSFNAQFRKYLERFEILTQNPSAVTLRKTYGYRIWELGGKSIEGLLAVQKALGHRTLEYTMDYLGVSHKMVEDLQMKM
ncbi:tyrosine-type recombinase/integrase [Ekhidna sp. MALMAid0563]|uniref:tyrosine-type recombinase/integrase n=1 Tax=Ekhidna sp. MALMAid0563 TaxID=3143937 RepID=UPI0032DE6BC6